MLNQGLWVFDKSGNIQGGGPESLYQFWSGKPGANGQTLPARLRVAAITRFSPILRSCSIPANGLYYLLASFTAAQ